MLGLRVGGVCSYPAIEFPYTNCSEFSLCLCTEGGFYCNLYVYRSWDAVRWVHREGFQSLLKLYDPDKYLIVLF